MYCLALAGGPPTFQGNSDVCPYYSLIRQPPECAPSGVWPLLGLPRPKKQKPTSCFPSIEIAGEGRHVNHANRQCSIAVHWGVQPLSHLHKHQQLRQLLAAQQFLSASCQAIISSMGVLVNFKESWAVAKTMASQCALLQ